MAKSPFSSEVNIGDTDPANLYTGSGSQMFRNERIREENRTAKTLEETQTRQTSELIPVANDLLEKLARMKAEKADIGSYLSELYATEGKPKVKEENVRVEFRARQMALKDLTELESWIRNQLRRNH